MNRFNPENGEKAVVLVEFKQYFSAHKADETRWNYPISKVIPAWKTPDGKYISPLTGEEVSVGENSQERVLLRGMECVYPEGEHIILTRNGRGETFFMNVFDENGVRKAKGVGCITVKL